MKGNIYGIMIKYPEPGKVKTRLAKEIGEEQAAAVCRQLAEQIMRTTLPDTGQYGRIVLYDPPERLRDFESWFLGESFVLQTGDGVGRRMDNAIKDLLATGAEKAILTGSDIPGLSAEILIRAFAALDDTDIVIGPARDGGYYLIGMKTAHSEIFHNVPWSTETVLQKTIEAIHRLGLKYQTVTSLSDLDRKEDYEKAFGRIQG